MIYIIFFILILTGFIVSAIVDNPVPLAISVILCFVGNTMFNTTSASPEFEIGQTIQINMDGGLTGKIKGVECLDRDICSYTILMASGELIDLEGDVLKLYQPDDQTLIDIDDQSRTDPNQSYSFDPTRTNPFIRK